MQDDDLVFKALADPTRRLLLDRLFERDGRTLTELEAEVPDLTRFGVMRHLSVLEEAGLVVPRKQGRYKKHYLNPVPVALLAERWLGKYRERHAAALLELKDYLEGDKPVTVTATATQVYQMYINAPQQKVWEAITTPEIVATYFHGAQVEGSYQPGTKIRTASPDGTQEWGNNTVLESDPPRRLVHTWRSLYDPDMAAEPESRVTWEIAALPGGYSRLTLIHDQLDASPKTAASVTGWAYFLSSLKSVLETGSPLPPPPRDN